ncbi:MAG: hypothetical protein PHY85_09300 [Bacteroidales bacterium]|nr:hypothetical protein [Bacteroidales bacterium]
MKRNLLLISLIILFSVSCTQDKTEIGLEYHETIVNQQTEVLDAFEEVLDAVTNDIEILQLKQETAIKITQEAIKETEKIEIIENGEILKTKSLNLLQGINGILTTKIEKIIEIRKTLNLEFKDELVDELNEIILISHDHIDSLIIDFNKAQIDFGSYYNFKLIEEKDEQLDSDSIIKQNKILQK